MEESVEFEKKNMIEKKEQLLKLWQNMREITNDALFEAFRQIPREKFIGQAPQEEAYGDYPLPIGYGQTISQPSTVMMMLQLLELSPGQKVLEVGAGSAYNAALISRVVEHVYTVERIPQLVESARKNLQGAGIKNVTVVHSDGKLGHPEQAPYDRIIVTAAAESFPDPLFDQLKPGGMLVLPLGPTYRCEMLKVTRTPDNQKLISRHGLFSFVPLV